jgi:hypothetical protein
VPKQWQREGLGVHLWLPMAEKSSIFHGNLWIFFYVTNWKITVEEMGKSS